MAKEAKKFVWNKLMNQEKSCWKLNRLVKENQVSICKLEEEHVCQLEADVEIS